MHLRHSAAIPTPTGWKLRVDMDSKAWILIRPPCMSINARFDSSTTIYSLSGSRALAYKTQVFAAFFQHELKARYCKKKIAMLPNLTILTSLNAGISSISTWHSLHTAKTVNQNWGADGQHAVEAVAQTPQRQD